MIIIIICELISTWPIFKILDKAVKSIFHTLYSTFITFSVFFVLEKMVEGWDEELNTDKLLPLYCYTWRNEKEMEQNMNIVTINMDKHTVATNYKYTDIRDRFFQEHNKKKYRIMTSKWISK